MRNKRFHVIRFASKTRKNMTLSVLFTQHLEAKNYITAKGGEVDDFVTLRYVYFDKEGV